MATVMYGAIFIVAANTVVDMLYVVIDPRARDGR
jgi:peptide/nickel transport system permease protein